MQKDGVVYKLQLNRDQTKIVSAHHFCRFSYDQNNFFEDKKMSKLFRDIPDIDFFSEDVEGNIWYIYNVPFTEKTCTNQKREP